jgi:NADPH-dependent 2,4-dienoyl-CoA reductase/sulfur reductase-like enzyme
MSRTFVVVGGGLAGATAVTTLRELGYDGRLVVFGAEPHLPYERPPLSKGYLLGQDPLDSAFVHPQGWYDEHDVDLRLGEEVRALDVADRTVTAAGPAQPYDRLLIATGAAPRHLALADESGVEVAYLRTIEDSERLKASFADGRRVVVVGGGWIGLEVASAARQAGCAVTVLESLELPLLRVLGPEVAPVFADLHREHGVDLRTGVKVASMEATSSGGVVRLGDGSGIEADLVVVGVGVIPLTGLAERAGLAVDDGILVDAGLAASAPGVFAAGDVANAEHPLLGRRVRVEHWDTAIEQGKVAARRMLGQDVVHDRLPYFFTDQYDLGMEYVGSVGPDGYDDVVVRGDTSSAGGRTFTAFWLKGGQVQAGMHANDWDAIDHVRGIVGRRVDAVRLRDESTSLADLAKG